MQYDVQHNVKDNNGVNVNDAVKTWRLLFIWHLIALNASWPVQVGCEKLRVLAVATLQLGMSSNFQSQLTSLWHDLIQDARYIVISHSQQKGMHENNPLPSRYWLLPVLFVLHSTIHHYSLHGINHALWWLILEQMPAGGCVVWGRWKPAWCWSLLFDGANARHLSDTCFRNHKPCCRCDSTADRKIFS